MHFKMRFNIDHKDFWQAANDPAIDGIKINRDEVAAMIDIVCRQVREHYMDGTIELFNGKNIGQWKIVLDK